ncbi:RING finger protein 24 isoform X3 [Bufo bufo]|uniref:RING finger protein 24 isoform X3 n=1 Tax=Bufo bufo TaxID=8384 RepID=UPI001ABDD207|nr:RING finger protein 24 isoform X3 [Bufo bufo]
MPEPIAVPNRSIGIRYKDQPLDLTSASSLGPPTTLSLLRYPKMRKRYHFTNQPVRLQEKSLKKTYKNSRIWLRKCSTNTFSKNLSINWLSWSSVVSSGVTDGTVNGHVPWSWSKGGSIGRLFTSYYVFGVLEESQEHRKNRTQDPSPAGQQR